jgi:hypothetical protein
LSSRFLKRLRLARHAMVCLSAPLLVTVSCAPSPSSTPPQSATEAGSPVTSSSASAGSAAGASARIDAQAVQTTVRGAFPRYRACYEAALGRNPIAAGMVRARLVIGLDGVVSSATDSGSTLPDRTAVECVLSEMGRLVFPKPEGKPVTIIYPINFTPSTGAEDAKKGSP